MRGSRAKGLLAGFQNVSTYEALRVSYSIRPVNYNLHSETGLTNYEKLSLIITSILRTE